ncbi:MAG: TonB family protein [Janthinobacterium lividum]
MSAIPAAAQQADSVRLTSAQVVTEYVDAAGQKLSSPAGADHRVETTYTDSLRARVRVFYPSGKLKEFASYSNLRRHVLHGRRMVYYESGQLHRQADFVAGNYVGELLVYYPDGTLRRRDQYAAGKRTAGECFAPDGHPVAYFEYEQMPIYPEGTGNMGAIVTAIQQRVRYPASALRQRLQGTIKVAFTVNAAGGVQDARIVEGVDETKFQGAALSAVRDLEATVVQAVQHLKQFQPGQQDGEKVAVRFTAPITFKIQ